jgi:hypothetical protein
MAAFFVSLQLIMVIFNQEGQKKEIKFESGLTYHIVPNAPPVPYRETIFTRNSFQSCSV